ncbi:MAG TPA: hypothetical protein VKY31_16560, partial [Terriglobia bacterium]|nr:hypothetical protein [Terriglobia bacterium]
EAKFKDAIQLLQHADDLLRTNTGRTPDKINVKLQLALAHVGLNEVPQAKASLREVFALDGDYRLDPQQFPPKFLTLADEAKSEQSQVRCQQARTDARKYLDAGNSKEMLSLLQSMKPKCTGLETFEPETAELVYKSGLEAYKAGQFSDALQKFQTTLKLSPKHDLAAQYVDLTQNKLQLNVDRLLLDWRKTLDGHQYKQAAARYAELKASQGAPPAMLDQMRTDYRNALTSAVDSWNRACAASDAATMDGLRSELPESLPQSELGDDILAQRKTCTKKGCTPMAPQLVMARLKIQVNPVIPPAFQELARRSQMAVQVKTKVDEKGNVTVLDAQGGNPMMNEAVRAAVEQWKFVPIVDASGPRCVETELSVTIKP